MKAVAVHPSQRNSVHLEDVPTPSIEQIPDGRGVLVKVLRVGVNGTDKEINEAEYGAAPPGDDTSVRRPGGGPYGTIGLQDFTGTCRTLRR